ncbi:MAG: glycosyltransferase family 4 protein [Synergistaceae bacterium]|nr:glycosyltransferase family 4 protein [Synergistaceae bacterium]
MNDAEAVVAAISETPRRYGSDVWFDIEQYSRESYLRAADKLNNASADLLAVEHEYGIFGGEGGEYLLDLIDGVQLPVVTTLHTVVFEPNPQQKRIIQALGRKSAAITVMADNSIPLLEQVYGLDASKIERIPHGVPRMDLPSRETLKKEMGLTERAVVSTFGLLGPGKGLEYGIQAIKQAAEERGDILYFILGQTHPMVKKQFGETYRSSLQNMVRELGLEHNVRFVNKYLTKEEIIRYLKLSDIYMTPYLGREQAVSGTLAYAVGYGRAIVSTPYVYAQEMLADGRGLLADFEDTDSLARHISWLLENPEEKQRMEEKTQKLGAQMMWDRVARQYADVFARACHKTVKNVTETLT